MRRHRLLIVFLLLLVCGTGVYAQSRVVMPIDRTLEQNMCSGDWYTISSPTLDSSYIGRPLNGGLHFTSAVGSTIRVNLSATICDYSTRIRVYDGDLSGTLLGTIDASNCRRSPFNYTASSGSIYIHYTTVGTDSCFDSFSGTVTDLGISNVSASSVTGTSAVINWSDATPPRQWTIRYGTSPGNLNNVVHARSHPYTLQGLDELTTYYYQVFRSDTESVNVSVCRPKSLTTQCDYDRPGCVDFNDLTSCRVKMTNGSYTNPFASTASSPDARHVYITSRTRDSRAGTANGTLWTIPDGEIASIRLGNENRSKQGEGITYTYHVDTRYYDLLILKYAVVLEDADHGSVEQPRFEFAITNAAGQELDANCNSAKFIPTKTTRQQWKKGTKDGSRQVYWKDWTTIGLDLSPLDGQTIQIKLRTNDCAYDGGHFAYAYFVLKCANRRIESLHCGADVSNTFKAPDGFSYEWFNTNNPSVTLSTADTLHVDEIGVYGCTMRFQGQNSNSTCEFTSNAIAGPRYPTAIFDTVCTDTINCKFRFHMSNNSLIAEDEAHTRLTNLPCESYEWIIDDSIHFYTTDIDYDFTWGNHRLQLVAKLSGGLCSDTLTYNIYRYPVCRIYDTINPSICSDSSVWLIDEWFNRAGQYRKDVGMFTTIMNLDVRQTTLLDTTASVCDSMAWDNGMNYKSGQLTNHLINAVGCDSLRQLNLTIRNSTFEYFPDTCVENQLPRAVGYTAFPGPVGDTLLHVINVQNCDSSIYYSLHVWWNIFDTFDTTLCHHYLPIYWGPFYFDHASTKTTTLSEAGSHGEDSTVTLKVIVFPDYYDFFTDTLTDNQLPHRFRDREYIQTVDNDTFYMNSVNGCDSVISYSLWIDYHVVSCDKFLQFPNMVTPNGDGVNDRFVIKNLLENDCYQHNELTIFNRWGKVVFHARDIKQDEDFWTPDNKIPEGVYYFHFYGAGARGTVERNGVIEVMR